MSKLNLHTNMLVADAKLIRLLGAGESGEVWSALNHDGNVVAMKIYKGKEEVRKKAEHEYEMACRFNNDNIIAPFSLSYHNMHPVIILPYCEGRSVDGVAAHFTENMIWKLIMNISYALSAIHESGYAHLDVKPSNILWDGKQFILSDFGACMKPDAMKKYATATDTSSYRFDAPELHRQPCPASDMWSLGATIFYLYMGCHVFNGLGGRSQHKDSPIPYMRKSLPKLSQLVRKCLDVDPSCRPSSRQVYEIASETVDTIAAIPIERPHKYVKNNFSILHENEFWSDAMMEPE